MRHFKIIQKLANHSQNSINYIAIFFRYLHKQKVKI